MIADETDVLDYENIRKNLGLMVIDATVNRERLENIVHENIEDLALVPIIFINKQHDDECIKIKYEYLKVWWVTGFMVMEDTNCHPSTRLHENRDFLHPDDEQPELR